jgi:hypothetical protein
MTHQDIARIAAQLTSAIAAFEFDTKEFTARLEKIPVRNPGFVNGGILNAPSMRMLQIGALRPRSTSLHPLRSRC